MFDLEADQYNRILELEAQVEQLQQENEQLAMEKEVQTRKIQELIDNIVRILRGEVLDD